VEFVACVNTVVDDKHSRPQGSTLTQLSERKICTLLARAPTPLLPLLVHLRQVDIPRHALSRARPRRCACLRRRRLGLLLLAPQRGRVDDALDDITERLCHAHRRLGGRLDEQTPRALGE
jgi:hypothetical protein